MADRILVTTDDLEHAVRSNAGLEAAGFQTTLASLDEARQAVRREPPPDCLVVTGGLHETGAAQLLPLARDRSISTLGLVEQTEPDAKGLARRLGLTAYLTKPADPAEVTATVRRLVERRRLQQRTGIIGESPAIQEVLVKIEQMAPVSSTVLIEGDSGTGKELVARAIHDLSPRRAKPFIAVNSAAVPETLLESELFGHEKGAFTGAVARPQDRHPAVGAALHRGVREAARSHLPGHYAGSAADPGGRRMARQHPPAAQPHRVDGGARARRGDPRERHPEGHPGARELPADAAARSRPRRGRGRGGGGGGGGGGGRSGVGVHFPQSCGA